MCAIGSGGSDPYLQAALDAGRWIAGALAGTTSAAVDATLYSGSPGAILFFLELYRHTSDRTWLDRARAAADSLLTSVDTLQAPGLYDGLGGAGFTLAEVFRITRDKKYRDGAVRSIERIGALRNPEHDIYSGSSGTGLFLLWASRELDLPAALKLAVRAGDDLLAAARHPESFDYPNFSHGFSGVAYFLATLGRATGEHQYVDAASDAAEHLIRAADTSGDGCVLYHDRKAPHLYYLGWCHGPAGTARLFYRLHQLTSDTRWMKWVERAALGATARGGPRRAVVPGEWDNVGVCCGVAGQARFFLGLHVVMKNERFLALAREASEFLIARTTRDPAGARWTQAEHRLQPELREAQTGYMQGAAGIGMWLLHMSAFERGAAIRPIVLPDNPFPY